MINCSSCCTLSYPVQTNVKVRLKSNHDNEICIGEEMNWCAYVCSFTHLLLAKISNVDERLWLNRLVLKSRISSWFRTKCDTYSMKQTIRQF